MTIPRFTVLLCIHRAPALLPFAIETVLWQSHADFELFVICDGAPAETAACARSFAQRDPRVRVFEFEKGEHNGERHRDTALAQATGVLIAHISDDDLWFPDHLRELGALLAEVEFGNLLLAGMSPERKPVYFRAISQARRCGSGCCPSAGTFSVPPSPAIGCPPIAGCPKAGRPRRPKSGAT